MNWAGESVRAVPLHLRRRDSDAAANHHHDDSEAGVEDTGHCLRSASHARR